MNADAKLPAAQGPFIVWENAFAPGELDAIARHGATLTHAKAMVDSNTPRFDPAIRVTNVAWIEHGPETYAFYARLGDVIQALNSQFFHYDLMSLGRVQYAIYDGTEQGHFDWHVDYARETRTQQNDIRKLSITIQLSDAQDYEGGELQAQIRNSIDIAPKTKGAVVAFPSFVLHRVTPVTKGVRRSLVAWVLGPDYR